SFWSMEMLRFPDGLDFTAVLDEVQFQLLEFPFDRFRSCEDGLILGGVQLSFLLAEMLDKPGFRDDEVDLAKGRTHLIPLLLAPEGDQFLKLLLQSLGAVRVDSRQPDVRDAARGSGLRIPGRGALTFGVVPGLSQDHD